MLAKAKASDVEFDTLDTNGKINKILDEIMIQQTKEVNVPSSQAKEIKSINFKIYNFNNEESNQLIERIKVGLSNLRKRISINITGIGFTAKEKEIITFELKDY